MNTKKVLKKLNSTNLFKKVTIELNQKVYATFKEKKLNDGVLEIMLETFPPKKYDLSISFVDGEIQVEISAAFNNVIRRFHQFPLPEFPRPFRPRF